jgi:hypothetical protein
MSEDRSRSEERSTGYFPEIRIERSFEMVLADGGNNKRGTQL